VRVTEEDSVGGYLASRLLTVRRLLDDEPDAIWPNQYENYSNPRAHCQRTGPEIYRQCPDMDAIFVAVSTGGTLAGVSRYLKEAAPSVRVIAVDLCGSRVFGRSPGRRLVTGIGSSRPSSFLRPGDYDDVVVVDDRTAISTCHRFRNELDLGLGGSSGAVIAACSRYLLANTDISRPVCICPDGQLNYLNTLYSPTWLKRHDLAVGYDATIIPFDGVKAI
jgi:N-(2-amino-2-carboxyethyl)-L-glutamate synthase